MKKRVSIKMNRQVFYNIYQKLQQLIAPKLKFSQDIYEDVLNENCIDNVKWLDLGCGHHLLSTWRLQEEKELISKAKLIVGVDYDAGSLAKHKTIKNKVRGDITKLPFPDNTFDLITSNMVFEHLDCPEEQLKEISRVLSKGGKLIFHTPNNLGYSTLMAKMIPEIIKDKLIYFLEGRGEEDVFPAYYKINSPSKIRKVAMASGFNVLKIKMICSTAVFVILTPIVFFELIWIRFLMSRLGKPLRTNLIVILEKK